MRFWALRRASAVIAAIAIVSIAVSATPAAAQVAPNQAVAELLLQNPQGGPRLVSAIRDLVLQDRSTLDSIIQAASTSNADQQASIGIGLATAANIAVTSDPAFANAIAQAVAASGVTDVANSFASSSQVAIGSTAPGAGGDAGAGAGGGGGGGGGGPAGGNGGEFSQPTGGTNTGTGEAYTTPPTQTVSQNMFTGASSGGVNSTSSTSPR